MTEHLRNRIAAAIRDSPARYPDDIATAVLAALLTGAEREPRTRLDDLTSNQLDRLYDDLDQYGEILASMNERVIELEQRAAAAEAEARRWAEAESADAASGSYAGRAKQAERQRDAISRMRLTAMANLGIATHRLDQIRDAARLHRQTLIGTSELYAVIDADSTPALEATSHIYLSTGCFHGDHDYCKSMTGLAGAKRPASCKKCGAKCICGCHGAEETATTPEPVVHACPPDGSGIMPCCGRTPFETPGDRITMNPNDVTCLRAGAAPATEATEATDGPEPGVRS